MNVQNFLLSYGQLISVTLIPVVVWFLGIKFQNRMLKRKAKEDLFLKLMANRKKNPPSIEWSECLNQIDVVFQDDKNVRTAWRSYFDSLHSDSQHFANQNSFQLDLLSEIATSLGYKYLKQTELDRFYQPVYFGEKDKQKQDLISEQLRVFRNSPIFADTFENSNPDPQTNNRINNHIPETDSMNNQES